MAKNRERRVLPSGQRKMVVANVENKNVLKRSGRKRVEYKGLKKSFYFLTTYD